MRLETWSLCFGVGMLTVQGCCVQPSGRCEEPPRFIPAGPRVPKPGAELMCHHAASKQAGPWPGLVCLTPGFGRFLKG